MSLTPHDPGVPVGVQTHLSGYTYQSADGSFSNGSITRWLMVEQGATAGTIKWGTGSVSGNPLSAPIATDATTAAIIQNGTINADGSISRSGTTYRLQIQWDGSKSVAVAV